MTRSRVEPHSRAVTSYASSAMRPVLRCRALSRGWDTSVTRHLSSAPVRCPYTHTHDPIGSVGLLTMHATGGNPRTSLTCGITLRA